MSTIADLWPRRAPGLPPGQREVRTFPRFSDKPLRWAPRSGPARLDIQREGHTVATIEGADWHRFDPVEHATDFHCVTTWTKRNLRWSGVRLADVVAEVLGGDVAPYMVATAADGQTAIYMSDDALDPSVLLATGLDGEPLDHRHGAPLRLVSPLQYGYKSPKHLVAIDFVATEPTSTLGPKEHLRARVDREERHATLPNWALRWPYRLTVVPTALAAERGLANSPA